MQRPRTLTSEVLNAALVGLEAQKQRIDAQIAEVRAMLPGRPAQLAATPAAAPRKRKKFSAAARRHMKEAQQRRWAKAKGESEPPQQATKKVRKVKRRISEEGMKRIIAATKKRWAAFRKVQAAKRSTVKAKAAKKSAPVKKAASKKTAPVSAQVAEAAAQ